jgi:amino acid adenylation domain-containing protein
LPVGTSNVDDIYELSPLQQGMLLHSAHDGAADMYLSQQTYTAVGELDTDVLVAAWEAAAQAHPALRTSFHWQGLDRPLQVVHRNVPLPVFRHDWTGVDREQELKRLEQLHTDDRAAGFDLAAAPLQRLHLIDLGPDRHGLVWTYHHLLMDGWSVPIFFGEVVAQYRRLAAGTPPPPPPPPFRDYIAWLQRQDLEAPQGFWREYLGGVRPSRLAPLRPWDPRRGTGPVERRMVDLPADVATGLREAAARHRVTFGTVVQAAWALLLRAYTGRAEVTFGCASSGRPVDLPGVERMVGMFANTLPVRVTVPDDGDLGGWLRDLQRQQARTRRYEYTPLADVKRWAGAPGQQLFESLIVLENYGLTVDATGITSRLTFQREALYDKISFPLTMTIAPGAVSELQLLIHRDRFEPGFIDDVLTRLQATFAALSTADRIAGTTAAAGPMAAVTEAPERVRPEAASPIAPPATATEEKVAEVFRETLGRADVDVETSFFELGGDSFDAVRAIGRIEGASLGMLAVHPSVRALSAALAAGAESAGATPPLVPVPRDGALVCAFQQEAVWFMNQLEPASTTYHIPFPLRIRGRLDVPALERALHALVSRHEALRTRFVNRGGRPRQVVDPAPAGLPLPVVDLPAAEVQRWAAQECARPFDLATGPVFRAAVARISPTDHAVVVVAHHIVADGWSTRVMAGELSARYAAEIAGRPLELPPLPIQPADHAAWQHRWLEGAERDRQVGWWRETLAELSTVDFPADRPRPARPTFAGRTIGRRLPATLGAAAEAYAREHQVSLLAVLQAALLTVLRRYTGQTDLPLGSLFSGRTRPDIEPLVGFFGNTLVLRTRLDGDPTFADLVRRCHRTVLDATAHQDVPFALVVDALRPERVAGRTPLFQVGLTLLPRGISEGLPLDKVAVRPIDVPEHFAAFDISVDLSENPQGGLDVSVEYATDLFDDDRMQRFIDHYGTAIANGLRAPEAPVDELEIMGDGERDLVVDILPGDRPLRTMPRLRAAARRMRGRVPDRPVHALVRRAATRRPDAPAVVDHDGGIVTYAQLDRAANQLAARLRRLGVAPGTLVGIRLPNGADRITAMLATWKAGGGYLPLGSDDGCVAAPVVVVTDRAHAAGVPAELVLDAERDAIAAEPTAAVDGGSTLDDVAGVLPTTAGPVVVPHRAVQQQIARLQAAFRLRRDDRVLHRTPTAYDAVVRELAWPLAVGAVVVVAPDDVDWPRLVAERQVTTLNLTPTLLRRHLDDLGGGGSWRRVFSSGEPLRDDTARRFRAVCPDVELTDVYGTAETGAAAAGPGGASIGRPLAGRLAYVLDDRLLPVPVGVPGRLFVAGPGLAHGYLGLPSRTAQRFLPDPYAERPGQRMVDTGDLACWRVDGTLALLARADRSVRLRGHRVDLGTVEAAVADQSGVRECAVRPTAGGLTAYVAGAVDPETVRRRLGDRLPAFLQPRAVVVVPALPLTPDGRLDPDRLPTPAPPVRPVPLGATERRLADLWRELLGVDPVHGDDFFALGGNSLAATELVARIHDAFGIRLGPGEVFTAPTLELLAARLDEAAGSPASPAPKEIRT